MPALPTLPSAVLTVVQKLRALWTNQVGQWLAFLASPPLFRGSLHVAGSVNNNAWTQITIDTEFVDNYNGHSIVTNTSRYTAQYPGWYSVSASIAWAINSTGIRGSAITKNGGAVGSTVPQLLSNASTASTPSYSSVQGEIQLAVGDYVESWGYQSSGSPLATIADAVFFSARWLSS